MARWYDKYNPSEKDQFEKIKDEFFNKHIKTIRLFYLLHILSILSAIYLWGKYVY
jgi:hypothetical protein